MSNDIEAKNATAAQEAFVKETMPLLQIALNEGWKKYQAGNRDYDRLKTLYTTTYIEEGGTKKLWYETTYAGKITNPQHMELARLIGEKFVLAAAQNGIALGYSFPGLFRESGEFERARPKPDFRRFALPVYVEGNLAGEFLIDFNHTHEVFGFVEPPQLSFAPQSLLSRITNRHFHLNDEGAKR